MIAKISDPRGERIAGLIYYLFGPGRREEHTDPHLIAGWRHPAELEPPLRPGGGRDFRRLGGLLQQPHPALGPRRFARPVWHCAVRAAPEDKMLSDAEWAQIAGDLMCRTRLSPHGQEDDAVRWVAVRHGDNHIHIVAMLARQDGGRPRLSNERYRVREACRAAEEWYGLRRTAPGDRTAARRPTRAEHEKTARRGWQESPRVTLRRAVSTAAAGASSEQEFFARLAGTGLLVRKRPSTRDPGKVTGYAVALPANAARGGGPVWFGGGKLAADLTLPKLRRRWAPVRNAPAGRFTAPERNAIWEQASKAASSAAAQIRSLAASNPSAAAAAAVGSRVLRQAADSYDRAARAPYGRIPRPTPVGNSLRRAARLLANVVVVTDDSTLALVTLVTRLAALAEAVAELRSAQGHAAQAAAARRAAEQLFAAHGHVTPPARESLRARPATAVQQARLDAPALRLLPRRSSPPGIVQPPRPAARSPRKTRGPTL